MTANSKEPLSIIRQLELMRDLQRLANERAGAESRIRAALDDGLNEAEHARDASTREIESRYSSARAKAQAEYDSARQTTQQQYERERDAAQSQYKGLRSEVESVHSQALRSAVTEEQEASWETLAVFDAIKAGPRERMTQVVRRLRHESRGAGSSPARRHRDHEDAPPMARVPPRRNAPVRPSDWSLQRPVVWQRPVGTGSRRRGPHASQRPSRRGPRRRARVVSTAAPATIRRSVPAAAADRVLVACHRAVRIPVRLAAVVALATDQRGAGTCRHRRLGAVALSAGSPAERRSVPACPAAIGRSPPGHQCRLRRRTRARPPRNQNPDRAARPGARRGAAKARRRRSRKKSVGSSPR